MIAQWNETMGLEGRILFACGADGLVQAVVCSAQAQAHLALQGGHLIAFRPSGEEELLWMSPDANFARGKSLRGGIPVCWPWFGPHPDDATQPAHGIARTMPWLPQQSFLLENGAIRLHLTLIDGWPGLDAELIFTVGETLEIALITTNKGTQAVTLTQALHSYFSVGDVRQVSLNGLDGCDYLDKVNGGVRQRQQGAITINSEVDRIYLQSPPSLQLHDPVLQRTIHITSAGSGSSVVWNPWIEKSEQMGDMGHEGYLHMLCVETTNADEDAIELAAGASHRIEVQYRIAH
ncbi:MAG: D-hexose-6-phosphate mutarotase [Mariprofundales bacterium]|nr:D-hexose-6-phosphate mutarotase [Mariprofundales bacterium]